MFKLVEAQSQAALQQVLLDSQEHLLGLLDYQPAGLNAVLHSSSLSTISNNSQLTLQ